METCLNLRDSFRMWPWSIWELGIKTATGVMQLADSFEDIFGYINSCGIIDFLLAVMWKRDDY